MARRGSGKNPGRMSRPTNPRRHEALDWRIRGFSYDAIAKKMSISKRDAYRLVSEGLDEARREYQEKANELMDIELKRCDRLVTALQDFCIPEDEIPSKLEEIQKLPDAERDAALEKLFKPSLKAMDMMEKILDRKARLLGFYRADDSKVKEPLPWTDDEGPINSASVESKDD